MNFTDFGIGSTIGGAFGLIGQAVNFEQQKKLAEQQNQYNIDMWKMQADYNSPQAQMQRFKEAGLNPNLIYGQGNNGNMSSAPQMVTPNAPDYSASMKRMGDIAQLFNIENLRSQIADRKKKEADAKSAAVDAERNRQAFEGEKQFGLDFIYNDSTGKYVPVPEKDELEVIAFPYARYLRNKILSENARRTYLLPFQGDLYRANKILNTSKNAYLQPQIKMGLYEQSHQPYSYWIDKGTKIAQPLFNFLKFF